MPTEGNPGSLWPALGERKSPNFIRMPEYAILNQVCRTVNESFSEICYLVGSAMVRPDYNDIDIRMIFSKKKFIALFGDYQPCVSLPYWTLTCISVSEYIKNRTGGLPIDFQIQRRDEVREMDWRKPREPLGLHIADRNPRWQRIREI